MVYGNPKCGVGVVSAFVPSFGLLRPDRVLELAGSSAVLCRGGGGGGLLLVVARRCPCARGWRPPWMPLVGKTLP